MMLKHRLLLGCLVLFMVLIGCTPATEQGVATPAGGESATATTETETTAVSQATATAIPEPIATEEPLPTAEPTIAPTLVPTETVDSPASGVSIIEIPSPNGAWVAGVVYDVEPFPNEIVFAVTNSTTNEQMVVERLTGGAEAQIPYTPYPVAWDAASETIYYFHYPVYMDGCGIPTGSALYGYNVTNGSGALLNEREGFYFNFSPDATHLAYLPSNSPTEPSTIGIYDIANDTLQEVPFDATIVTDPADEVIAEMVWHPTRPLIAMGVMVNVCVEVGTYALILLDTESMTQTIVEVETPFGFTIEGWEGENLLLVRTSENQLRKYDIEAGEWIDE